MPPLSKTTGALAILLFAGPLFAAVAAANRIPADPARSLDGVDLVPYLRGDNPGAPHERLFLRVFDIGSYTVREGDYKLIKPRKDAVPLLYNLASDPSERTNVADANIERVRTMAESFHRWSIQMIEPTIPGVNMKEWSRGY
jgi:arylsulfatase A-like enzyme